MTATDTPARGHGRVSRQVRPQWPDVPATVDPDAAHPRAVQMAEAMREGSCTFRDLIGSGFTSAEITEHYPEAKALAASLSVRQVSPGADLLADMAVKAKAAIVSHKPMPKGTADTQALYLAWGRYCAARNAHVVDPWAGQRERCLDLLRAYFQATTAGPAVTEHVVRAVAEVLEARH